MRRAGDVLNLESSVVLGDRHVEPLEVVQYQPRQGRTKQHEFSPGHQSESRLISMSIYLSDLSSLDAGGELVFPKADGGYGLRLRPSKGSAVFFYHLLEDGNVDDLSLHGDNVLRQGEKWVANVYVWDPRMPSAGANPTFMEQFT